MTDRALAGMKVLELAELVAGPYGAKLLADMGADVIKIEPLGGDSARRRGPFLFDTPHPENSGLFLYVNTSKRGITLDVETPTGWEIFEKLLGWADLFIVDRPPREQERLGLTHDTLGAINRRLVVTSVTPYGLTGPQRDQRAYHLTTYHASGAGHLLPSGAQSLDVPPMKGPGLMAEYDAGTAAAASSLAALLSTRRAGIGQQVDISKQEARAALDRVELTRYPNEGTSPSRVPTRRWFGGIVGCKDGCVLLSGARDEQWPKLVEVMGSPEWAKQERFQTEEQRNENREELLGLVGQWTAQHTRHELYHWMQRAGLPGSPVNGPADLIAQPQLRHRGFFVSIEQAQTPSLAYPSAPYKFSRTPWAARRVAPRLGEHNENVFCGLLGYPRSELPALRAHGII